MNKKYSFEWTTIKNKSGDTRKVLKSMSLRKKVIPKVRYSVKNHVRRYTKR